MNNIKFILPDFIVFDRNEALINIKEKYSYIFHENIEFYSFYGVFPNAIWNGGSCYFSKFYFSKKQMKKVRDFYNKKGIKITFTFTNSLITEDYLNDEYCNQMLEVFNNGENEILVVSPVLEQYIRKNYPKYKINRSIINTEKIPFLAENYHLTVMSKFKNRDFEFINKISLEERKKTELLCNEFCVNNCPFAYEHYKEYAYIQLHNNVPLNSDDSFGKCRFEETGSFDFLVKRIKNSKYWISFYDIKSKYVPLGFEYFKISGRGDDNLYTLHFLVAYLIKTKYRLDILVYLAEIIFIRYSHKNRNNGFYDQ